MSLDTNIKTLEKWEERIPKFKKLVWGEQLEEARKYFIVYIQGHPELEQDPTTQLVLRVLRTSHL